MARGKFQENFFLTRILQKMLKSRGKNGSHLMVVVKEENGMEIALI